MKIKKIKTAFTDERGSIADIFYKANIEHVAIIKTLDKGRIIRGNHYHKLTTQHIFMTKGSLRYWYREQDVNAPVNVIDVPEGHGLGLSLQSEVYKRKDVHIKSSK